VILSDICFARSADVGMLREYGASVREVCIERGDLGDYFVMCINEFSGDEILLGELSMCSAVKQAVQEWIEFNHQDSFLAVYSDEYEVVIVDYYHSICL
jgi:hypothetical protein